MCETSGHARTTRSWGSRRIREISTELRQALRLGSRDVHRLAGTSRALRSDC